MRAAVLAALVLLAATWQAHGQSSVTVAPSQEKAAAVEPEELSHILVLGDAVGGGLGAGLTRMAEIDGRYAVTIRFNEESGLARPEVYDWAARLPKILESSHYDIIVVLLGTNDRQMIRSDNARYGFNSQGWVSAYTARMDALLDALADSGARVFWVAIPPMADAQYDADLRAVAALQRQRVEARGFTHLDFRPQFTTPDGRYTDVGPDDTGTVRRLRGKDGISFFKAGNNRMGQLVLDAIRDAPAGAPAVADRMVPAKGDIQRPAAKEPDVPLFGQALANGEARTVVPRDITMNALAMAGSGVSPAAALQAIRAMTQPGSGAEKLLKEGSFVVAPSGRADDFAAPPEAAN